MAGARDRACEPGGRLEEIVGLLIWGLVKDSERMLQLHGPASENERPNRAVAPE